jgi:hypothetical protein
MERSTMEKSGNALERSDMPALNEASELLRQVAGPEPWESKKDAWNKALRRLKGETWTFNRVRDLWRQEPRARVSADELNELRRVAAARQNAARGQLDELLARIEALEARLNSIDPDFYRPHVDSLRRSVSGVGRADTAAE